ncbi:ABC transporter substrate-binding protein [Terracoccus luteus]|uniref:Multiple sugar transport system substrate-binding protein n=1 Tax=Terracoccus luteus TaxID=53356 RepID=A0A495XZN3_9MICO|nr:ABC transporter substrate-binding protein [Terracoccus luteus]MBB2987957.1 multiple sugar transport system substrate-binding protein [Terracoccus luteus]MCP2173608.1 multiple sugar transport system substrate-binding protein [Terracoccus luteus]RKT80070.1 multiple sugar transport system substrate-binding protein [Terracoccus luteus]
MSRPENEAQYLASLVPPSVRGVDRRTVLRGALGIGALLGTGTLAACGGGDTGSGGVPTGPVSGTVTVGSNQSDAVPKAAVQSLMDAFQKANSGTTAKINTVDHNTFQENINNYLQGSPDDVFTWFAGYRMRFFASKDLAGDVSDVWSGITGMSDALKKSSTGDDGKQYFIPATTYPWAVFYRKSVFEQRGYEVPKTLDDLKALGTTMQKDGLDPIAFGDKDGWPGMGTFDQLNLRINGYDYHVSLMAGQESWSSDKVKKVFDTWAGLLPIHQADPLGRTWQEAAQSLQQKKSGMYVLGSFLAQQFEKGSEQDDLDFFTFPEIDSTIGTDAIEAPIDGWMMSKRPKNEAAAKKLLAYIASPPAQDILVKADPSVIATNDGADTASYTALQKKTVEFVKGAKSIAQFMDRDTRPDFASTVMIPAIQQFLKNPKDIDGLVNSIEAQKKSIFGS